MYVIISEEKTACIILTYYNVITMYIHFNIDPSAIVTETLFEKLLENKLKHSLNVNHIIPFYISR